VTASPASAPVAGPSIWASPIRMYATVQNEVFPIVMDATGWGALGEYLSGPEFGAIATRVQTVTIINRAAGYGGERAGGRA
jgi:hypothetical protein